jgi:branched-chain amino acid transport system ATP-binding protein
MPETPLIALDGIDIFYGPIQALFGLTVHVNQGELVCLLGGNASGKSTTMKTVLGLVRPRAGQVRLDGRPSTISPRPTASGAASARCRRRGASSPR